MLLSRHQRKSPAALLPRDAHAIRPQFMSTIVASPADHPAASLRPRALSNLLLAVAAMVFAIVVVGGITRLTESGLSITQWNVVSGAIPPLTHADWSHAFELYRQTPQYREVAGPAGMTLS